jgi:hypothetical protein
MGTTVLPTAALALALTVSISADPPPTVPLPRILNPEVTIDGRLEEPVWSRAAVLSGFFQYLPTDDRPAQDSTTVAVLYSETPIYFGIRAYQDSALVRATLADRDRIAADDYVEILLDTFNDRRQAYLLGVNPVGVQADGTLRDAAQRSANYTTTVTAGAYAIDLSPDFVYESRGRLAPDGYEVEVRIPFKTLRYQATSPQDWGINVIRHVQYSGHEHTWTRVLQTNASFLAQAGTLTGLTDLRRGIVLDLNPEMTSTVTGTPTEAGWDYGGGSPQVGGNVRWGITSNLTLNGTANPDFSQVEADVAQLVYDPRQALFFPEKRPFFLDGIEYFETPTQLIYTRRLVDPIGAAKLTGKIAGTNVAFLSGADARAQSLGGLDRPFYNLLRVRRDLGGQNTLGIAYTDRVEGGNFNRVAAADGRVVFSEKYALTVQGGASATRVGAETRWGPMWVAQLTRAGRSFGFTVSTRGFHPDFVAGSGFVSRTGITYVGLSPRYTKVGAPGAAVESWTGNILLDGRWDWDRFFDGTIPNDPRIHFNFGVNLRGGWRLGSSLLLESFMYPAELYTEYAIERSTAGAVDTIPFTGTPRLTNLDVAINFRTPRFQHFSANGFVIVGRDDNFFEWASANIAIGTFELEWRPSEQLRVGVLYNHQQYLRPNDGSTVGLRRVPRLKLEYQITRAIFVRFVGQYDAETRDSLRDNSRTEDPILMRNPATGVYERTTRRVRNTLQVDWLFSFRPTPGTVVFAGYGSTLSEEGAFRFTGLERRRDGFFVKLSYLFRV